MRKSIYTGKKETLFQSQAIISFCMVIGLIIVLGGNGCTTPFGPTNPCTTTVVDDKDPCTTDTCTIGENGAAVVVHTPVECPDGQVCDDGVCVAGPECSSDEDCDDSDVCTDDVCNSNGVCENTNNTAACDDGDPCTTDDVCGNGSCMGTDIVCADDEECDNGICVEIVPECTGNSDCSDNLYCNGTETCIGGKCINGVNPCESNETCVEATDTCEAVPDCDEDSDCDDGLYCNGEETCSAEGVCVDGTPPCSSDACVEATDTCSETTVALTTGVDVLEGGSGADLFIGTSSATNPTWNMGDSIDGKGGTDTLRIVSNLGAAIPSNATISIETYEIQSAANDTLMLNAGATAPSLVNFVNGSNNTFTISNIPLTTSIGVQNTDSQITVTYKASDVTGGSDAMNLSLSGAMTNSSVTAGSIETFNVSTSDKASTLAALAGAQGTKLKLTGNQDLTITTDLANTFVTIDASTFTGDFVGGVATGTNVAVTLGSGSDRFEVNGLTSSDSVTGGIGTDTLVVTAAVSAGDLANVSGFERMRFVGDLDQDLSLVAAMVTGGVYYYSGTPATIAVTANQDSYQHIILEDATSFIPVAAVNGPGDIARVELRDADVGIVGTANYENVYLKSSNNDTTGTTPDGSANVITTLTMAVSGTATVTGSANLTIGAMTNAGTITATGFSGELNVKGSAGGDAISGGTGADTIEGEAGVDALTGGSGADTFVYTTETDSLNTAMDLINDFVSGTDKFDIDTVPTAVSGATAAANFNSGTVASTGTTTGTLATDLATAVTNFGGNAAMTQAGDVMVVKLTGASIGGTDFTYLVIESTGTAGYTAGEDAVIRLGGTSSTTLTVSDFK